MICGSVLVLVFRISPYPHLQGPCSGCHSADGAWDEVCRCSGVHKRVSVCSGYGCVCVDGGVTVVVWGMRVQWCESV